MNNISASSSKENVIELLIEDNEKAFLGKIKLLESIEKKNEENINLLQNKLDALEKIVNSYITQINLQNEKIKYIDDIFLQIKNKNVVNMLNTYFSIK